MFSFKILSPVVRELKEFKGEGIDQRSEKLCCPKVFKICPKINKRGYKIITD